MAQKPATDKVALGAVSERLAACSCTITSGITSIWARDEGATVEQVVQILVAEKNWVGGAGFNVTDEMKVTVAGQAAILVLGLEEPYYFDGVLSIIVYQGPYRHPKHPGFIPGATLHGEAWYRGPIVLSWRNVLESGRNASGGHNLVFHEFAHYLDGLDGEVDGDPPLAGREQEQNWYRVAEAEYLRLVGQARRDEVALLDHYGATNRAEFFAVATECFFEQPQAMQREHAELYAGLRDFFRQDPAQWLPDAKPKLPERKRKSEVRRCTGPAWRASAPKTPIRCSLFRSSISTKGGIGWRQPPRPGRFVWTLGTGKPISNERRPASNRGATRKALADCKRALRRDPDDWTTYRVRGAAYLGLGKHEAAKCDLDLGARRTGWMPRPFTCVAAPGPPWADIAGPSPTSIKSLAVRPLVAEVYYHNGLANQKLGDLDEAEANLAKAFQLDPLVDRRN